MAIRLHRTVSKNSVCYYIKEDYTDPVTKKRTTRNRKSLGNLKSLLEKYQVSSQEEVESILKQEIEQLKNEKPKLVTLQLDVTQLMKMEKAQVFNIGYLYSQKILSMLDVKGICQKISERHRFDYDLEAVLRLLVNTRIIAPGSKLSSLKAASRFYNFDTAEIQAIYRSLPVLAKERYFIENQIYKNSKKICERQNSVLYYDCTNFYFETEEEDSFRKYGKSKENRPNPIVQYGLFMDGGGIPIADICFEGNKNESHSMRELEKNIEKDFGFSRFIVCADAALNGFENKIYNDRKDNGAFIVTQPVKKLKAADKKWLLEPAGWKVLGSSQEFDISDLKESTVVNGVFKQTKKLVFYKEKWILTKRKSEMTGKKEELEERLIASFSLKYRNYQQKIRNEKLSRAEKMLKNPGKLSRTNNQRDPKYYIRPNTTNEETGEITEISYELDTERILEEMKYDGFYAVTTDLEDKDLGLILKTNQQRWEIEECFRIMKSELKTRPVFVSRKEAIEGHLLTCFLALTVYRILEQYLEEDYTVSEILETLRGMNITPIKEPIYKPAFERTPLTDRLAQIFEYQFAYVALEEKQLNKIVKNAKGKNMAQFLKNRERS